MNKVYIVSDGTGKTAEMALKAALTQFPGIQIEFIKRPWIKSHDQIKNVVLEASVDIGFIVHTLVSDNMRDFMVRISRKHNVETIDIMGPLLSRLSILSSISPSEKPGLFNLMNEDYFRRVETMNFAFKHDDGLRTQDLDKAEIILVGVSRTFKTPLSIYLAFKHWLVANIPIILNVDPPQVLFTLNPENVFFLNSTANRLSQLRRYRHEKLGEATGNYSTFEYVKNELAFAYKIFCANPGWSQISVTNKSIEEIATEIIALKRTNPSELEDNN